MLGSFTDLEFQHIPKSCLFLVEVQQPDPNLTGERVLSEKALMARGHGTDGNRSK